MKTKSIALLLISLTIGLSACKEKAVYKTFETQYSFKTTVPANALIASPLFPINFEEQSNSESEYAIHDTRKDLVEEVHLSSFLIEVVSPQTEDLGFLKSARFYINADAEPEMLIAWKDTVPQDIGQDLLFDIDSLNLAPYLKKEPFEIRTQVVTDENRAHDIQLQGTVHFSVTAKVLSLD